MTIINEHITPEIREAAAKILPADAAIFQTTITKDEIIRLLYEEYLYWSEVELPMAAFSLGPIVNIIAKIAMAPEQEDPGQERRRRK